jgi:chromosome segregation ATPase
MALQLFKKPQRSPPIERVKELSSRGFSEPEIIDILRKEGYEPGIIDLALTQVLKEKLQSKGVGNKENVEMSKIPTIEEIVRDVQPESSQLQIQQYSWEDYFNYIDYIIQSRIGEISKDLEKVDLKYQNLERRIEEINQSIRQTVNVKEESYHQIIKKMEELDSSMRELSQRINGLEEIFKEILPALIESVRSLSRLTQQK